MNQFHIAKMSSLSEGLAAIDEYGRPYIIIRNQERQKRLTGHDAIKVCIYILNNFDKFLFIIH